MRFPFFAAALLTLAATVHGADSWLPQKIEGLDRALGAKPQLGVSAVYVAAVASEAAAEEQPPSSATTTSADHGGAWLRIDTVEVGQGRDPIATFNGNPLRYAWRQAVTVEGKSGWKTRWMVEGASAGLFRYQVVSTARPWPVLTTQLYVK